MNTVATRANKTAAVVDDDLVRRALHQLAGTNPKGQHHEARWAHPFAARMPLSVAEHFVNATTTPEAVVLDPMVGAGTTTVAARRLGRRAIGVDRDPLAVVISRCVASTLDGEEIERMAGRVLRRARACLAGVGAARRVTDETAAFIDYWFPDASQRQLEALAKSIRREPPGSVRDLAWLVFSSLIIAKSAGASRALDISRSRPHRRDDKAVVAPFAVWERRCTATAHRLPFCDTPASYDACILQGDARSLPIERATVDLVLTSPPYLNAIDYLRAHRFSLVWMGHSMEALRELRATMVGTERGLWTADGIPSSLEDRLESEITTERMRAQRRQYLSDMKKVLSESARVLRRGGLSVLAVGPRIVSAVHDDAAPVMSALADDCGLVKIASVTRHLKSSDRSLPFLGQRRDAPLARRMGAEVFVALRKQ